MNHTAGLSCDSRYLTVFLVSLSHLPCLGLPQLPSVTATEQLDTNLCLDQSTETHTMHSNMHLTIPSHTVYLSLGKTTVSVHFRFYSIAQIKAVIVLVFPCPVWFSPKNQFGFCRGSCN